MSLPSKLSRAICAYLISVGVGSVNNILPFVSQKPRTFPNVTVIPTQGNSVDPIPTGNYRFNINVSIRGSSAHSPSEPNPEFERVAFDALVKSVDEALKESADSQTIRETYRLINVAAYAMAVAVDATPEAVLFAQNNADMVDFTIMEWNHKGYAIGTADELGVDWEQVIVCDCICCPSQITGYT